MYSSVIPMKQMKWCICELERLQIQFDHPNPIRHKLLFAIFENFLKIKISKFISSLQFWTFSIKAKLEKDVMVSHMIKSSVTSANQSLSIVSWIVTKTPHVFQIAIATMLIAWTIVIKIDPLGQHVLAWDQWRLLENILWMSSIDILNCKNQIKREMKIICAGYPKTGSKSCSTALRHLGYEYFLKK